MKRLSCTLQRTVNLVFLHIHRVTYFQANYNSFWFLQKTNVLNIFETSRRKGLTSKWTIYKQKSDLNKKYQLVGNFGIMSVVYVVFGAHLAFTSLCRGLKYLLKILNSIRDQPTWPDFSFLTMFYAGCPIFEKVYHKNKQYLWLVTYIISKFSQNLCLINTHIFIYWHTRCNCKLSKAP